MIFKIIGVIGLIAITVGIILRKRDVRDILYIIGGVCLFIYSYYLKDLIFIILQAVFTIVAVYDLIKNKD